MGSHSRTRAFAAVVVAAALASAGCLNPHLNPFPAYPPYPYPYPYPPQPAPPTDKSAAPPVDNRTGESVARVQYQPPAGPTATTPQPVTPPAAGAGAGATPSTPLPAPNPLPATVPPTAPQQMPLPGAAAPNPHQRDDPTLIGSRIGLRPNEMPLDRALEILRRLDELIDENKKLQVRIKTLEANGLSREDALNETLREVEKATAEVVNARNDMKTLRADLNALREKVKQVEKDELDTLNHVIKALQKLLDDK